MYSVQELHLFLFSSSAMVILAILTNFSTLFNQPIPTLIVKIIENSIMYSVQELHLFLFSSSAMVILAILTNFSTLFNQFIN